MTNDSCERSEPQVHLPNLVKNHGRVLAEQQYIDVFLIDFPQQGYVRENVFFQFPINRAQQPGYFIGLF